MPPGSGTPVLVGFFYWLEVSSAGCRSLLLVRRPLFVTSLTLMPPGSDAAHAPEGLGSDQGSDQAIERARERGSERERGREGERKGYG